MLSRKAFSMIFLLKKPQKVLLKPIQYLQKRIFQNSVSG